MNRHFRSRADVEFDLKETGWSYCGITRHFLDPSDATIQCCWQEHNHVESQKGFGPRVMAQRESTVIVLWVLTDPDASLSTILCVVFASDKYP
ncbi:hypothetical protein TNCV_4528571 [Trichonephila clavipes]|nr:hypothetical protein TNCV_4528571 [Trichonephila clavipes]